MKVFVALFVLMSVAIGSATFIYPCGPSHCGPYYSCVFDNNYSCIYRCNNAVITQKITNRWSDNNGQSPYVQVEVTVRNPGPRDINNVIIGAADGTLNLKDGNAIWGIARIGNDFTLPSYAATIKAGQTYTYGYINKGNHEANLYLKNVHVL